MRRCVVLALMLAWSYGQGFAGNNEVEIIRDNWGVPHVFADKEADGFFGLGYVCAEDRLVQMDLFRRRARGRLAEIYGPQWVESDRTYRIGGISQYCAEASANLPRDMRGALRAYAAGVNAFIEEQPDRVRKRFAPLGVTPDAWTPSDCLAAWMGMATLFDRFTGESSIRMYLEFQRLVDEVGLEAACKQRATVLDDDVAIVPESEMARNRKVYRRLKSMERQIGYHRRSADEEPIRFSHAWAVGGQKSTTGKPILESDPQTSVNNPAIWYEFHLCAGRYDVRGVGVAGCPAMLIGWNRNVAWGATALGTGCNVTFLDKLSDDGRGYRFRDKTLPFERRLERIDVKDAKPVVQEVLTNHHGFVFNSIARLQRPGEAFVSYYKKAQDKATSVRAMLLWMRAKNYREFRKGMEHYYSPGVHLVYADARNNIAYQTLAQIPLTKRAPRLALEGWTGEDEIHDRIPLDEMPNMLNPDTHYVVHANNLPAGSWYPYDLGTGIGDTVRSMRLRQLIGADRQFSVEDFEAVVHRDNVQPAVAALLPIARKIVEEDGIDDPAVTRILDALKDWDGRFDAHKPGYHAAMAVAGSIVTAVRGSPLRDIVGGGEGGVCHLARLAGERFAKDGATPKNPEAREYILNLLRMAGGGSVPGRGGVRRPAARIGSGPEIHAMPWQVHGPMRFPAIAPEYDLKSPPLTCGQIGTIWSQKGNSYTQIVDLADIDNSRSVLPPGVSEDPDSPFHSDQIPIWVKGGTHPAPLSRGKVEAVAQRKMTLEVAAYEGPDAPDENIVETVRGLDARFVRAIPEAAPARPAPGQDGQRRPGAGGELPGRKPDDARLESAMRYLINRARTNAEIDAKVEELEKYVKDNANLTRQLISGLRLVIHLQYGTPYAQRKMRVMLNDLGGRMPPLRDHRPTDRPNIQRR